MTMTTDRADAGPHRSDDPGPPGGTWRVVRTELRRGPALVMVLAVGGIGAAALFTHPEVWAGRWHELAWHWRSFVPTMGPVAAAIGAWHGGRDTRRRTTDLKASTPRRPELRDGLGWIVVSVAAGIGSLLPWAVGAVLVAPVATYGGTWWWTVLGGVVGVMAFALIGAAFGGRTWSVLDPPLVGVLAFAVFIPAGFGLPWLWLLPAVGTGQRDAGSFVAAGTTLAQVAWFGAVAALVVVLATSKRQRALVVTSLVALAGAIGVVALPDPMRVDDGASALVCAGSAPELCVAREKSFLLDSVGPIVADETSRWASFDDMPDRIVDTRELDATWPPPDGVHQIDFGHVLDWRGGLTDDAHREIAVQLAYAITVIPTDCSDWAPGPDAAAAYDVAGGWPSHLADPASEPYLDSGSRDEFHRLISMSDDDQLIWIGRYRDAVRSCDAEALVALGRELAS